MDCPRLYIFLDVTQETCSGASWTCQGIASDFIPWLIIYASLFRSNYNTGENSATSLISDNALKLRYISEIGIYSKGYSDYQTIRHEIDQQGGHP